MNDRSWRRRTFIKACAAGAAAFPAVLRGAAAGPPNVVIVYADDLGYADVGPFGAAGRLTPNLDRLAAEGRRFTSFYVAQAVCSASRTALLTGCYPNRVGILGALGPKARHGIHDDEVTIGEIAKGRGYATAVYGKWHLGHHPQFLPPRHGFDDYFGLPYSNDMWPRHPEAAFPDLPLVEGSKTIAYNPDQTKLTTWYTERAASFIEKARDRPFLLYLAHSMPHVPLHVSDRFKGKSGRGLYGDVIMEIDWSVGEIVATLERLKLRERTMVMFASDNGPWLSYGDHAGSAGPLREGKGTTWEGGVRVPCILCQPGAIPAGTACDEPVMTIDMLPTIAARIGAQLPGHPIDGKDIGPLIAGEAGAASPHEALHFYWDEELQAIRSREWKLHLPHAYRTLAGPAGTGGKPGKYKQEKADLALFDLSSDIGEKQNVAAAHPDIVKRIAELGAAFDRSLRASRRQPGRVSG